MAPDTLDTPQAAEAPPHALRPILDRHGEHAGWKQTGPAQASSATARRLKAGYLHCTNPDGTPVVFLAGELLPDWAPDPGA